MIYYNTNNNAYCSAVNSQNFETGVHNTVLISAFLYTRNFNSYSHFEILSAFRVLGVILTKYQQIHSDIQPAVQQMFTCLFTY